jgi:hypothetical protein
MMKITIKLSSGEKFTGETFGNGECIEDVITLFKGMLVSSGFHPRTVDDVFDVEDKWFTREEKNLVDNYQDMKAQEVYSQTH